MTRDNNMKLAALPPGVSALSPEGVAHLVEMLRGAGSGGPSHAQRLINWANPALQAVKNVRGDYKAVRKALDSAVPGSSKYLMGKARRGGEAVSDLAGALAEQHGPAVREKVLAGVDALKNRLRKTPAPAPVLPEVVSSPWYHDPASAVGAGLGLAGATGLGALGVKRLVDKHRAEQRAEQDYPMDTALHKISTALDLLADELDSRPVHAVVEEKTAEAADVFGTFSEFYKQQVGEEPPAALVEKLAQDADEETVDALKKLVKSAALERPTPLGEPSEGGGYREPPTTRGDVAKMAWEQFEETLLNYEGA